jgi:hypothetical protein
MINRFRIARKDLNLDPIEIETEGLTIGRFAGNDLVLNHPTVSRVQAGIKAIDGDYWIFNLSRANGTLLNGELIEQTPLADGDLIQIGPFHLIPQYLDEGLALEVGMSIKPLPVEATGGASASTDGKTVILTEIAARQREKATPRGTRRLTGTGKLTGHLAGVDELALQVFWDKRKREAGKQISETRLRPRGRKGLGKARFNWSPTTDLRRPWRGGVILYSMLGVGVLTLLAAWLARDSFAPGELSAAHASGSVERTPAVARQASAGSCTSCHTATHAVTTNCAACHTTDHFSPDLSESHTRAGLTCLSCHAEHHGHGFRPKLLADASCTSCHRDGSGITSAASGKALSTPHGGTFGYPVEAGIWVWGGLTEREWERKGLPGTPGIYAPKEQFHLIHVAGGSSGRSLCSDCHRAGFDRESVALGVRAACADCHGMDAQTARAIRENSAIASRGPMTGSSANGPRCVSCHAQHGAERNRRSSRRAPGDESVGAAGSN